MILFGSPLPTSGHSGRYPIEVHDFVIDGEYKNQMEGTIVSNTHQVGGINIKKYTHFINFPADRVYLPPMRTCLFCIPDHVWYDNLRVIFVG